MLHVKLLIKRRIIHVIAVCAPTFNTESCEKDAFYDRLREMIATVRSREELVVMGDFNARVGARTRSWVSGSADAQVSEALGGARTLWNGALE